MGLMAVEMGLRTVISWPMLLEGAIKDVELSRCRILKDRVVEVIVAIQQLSKSVSSQCT